MKRREPLMVYHYQIVINIVECLPADDDRDWGRDDNEAAKDRRAQYLQNCLAWAKRRYPNRQIYVEATVGRQFGSRQRL
ncbi:MAG TPA: hypothetical protein VLE72_02980 [Candidatus Saccharimonadales bacterium]|nr:hypothetical protein [Candidatus Saccharimonadales bacterium]